MKKKPLKLLVDGVLLDLTRALTGREPSKAHEGLVREQSFENCLVGGVLGKDVGALSSRPYGYPACKSGKLTPTVVFVFFCEVTKGTARLDLLGSLLMEVCPTRVSGPAS